ncbi:MAG: amidase domain-containing protein [Clostridia bacterium]|nr:amidase domain-containing protein [Clostridia bacterium]
MTTFQYDRTAAVAYAKKWAFGRNPAFYDFSKIGGDCTNFASQCIYAGAGVMNFTPELGWFYRSTNDRTASWTGVEFLHNFLVTNQGVGPFGKVVPLSEIEIGDIIQLGTATGDFYHSPVVVGFSRGQILVAAHTYDAYNKPLNSYNFAKSRPIHILGVRKDD